MPAGNVVQCAPPPAILHKLNDLTLIGIQAPETRARLSSRGVESRGNSAEEFLKFWRARYERWGGLIRTLGIKLET
jgi:hypothetical protein